MSAFHCSTVGGWGLAICLVVGNCALPLTSVPLRTSRGHAVAQHTCCCGSRDGGCCGTGCCRSRSPGPVAPAAVVQRLQTEPFDIVAVQDVLPHASATVDLIGDEPQSCSGMAMLTLQQRRVRLNI